MGPRSREVKPGTTKIKFSQARTWDLQILRQAPQPLGCSVYIRLEKLLRDCNAIQIKYARSCSTLTRVTQQFF